MRILYVCTGNSFRSTAAEALTRKYRSDLEVESAGTQPVGHIAGPTRKFLKKEDAEQYLKPKPESISQAAINRADTVVCMMPHHRQYIEQNYDLSEVEMRVWDVEDGIKPGIDPEEQLEKIRDKVKNLG